MGQRVLIVDDNRLVNDTVADALRSRGYDCAQTFDGAEALRTFEDLAPEALVLDLNLPKVHGLEVLRHVKRQRPGTVVVILTGQGSEQSAVSALKMGADDYLSKPVRQERLAETLRKSLERARRERRGAPAEARCFEGREADLAALFLEAPAALLQTDSEGVLRSANGAAARLLGRPTGDLAGRPVGDLLDPSVRQAWFDAVSAEACEGRCYEGEVFLLTASGEVLPAAVTAARCDDGGFVVSLRDLTRQKAMEQHFFESKKLASLGRVVEGVAHEVRNPVIAIGGFARKLVRELPPGDERHRYLDVILAEARRLEKMVQEIEDYVELAAHRRATFAPVDVLEVLDEALAAFSTRFKSPEIRVAWERPGAVPPMFGDRPLLGELFRALVDNACDAMAQGGRLAVGVECGGNWLRVRLGDTGVGIPAAELGEIFNPFVTSKTSGAGLGLARAYMIVEEHSGMIEFESEVGRGTVCTVSLPLDRRRIPRAGTP